MHCCVPIATIVTRKRLKVTLYTRTLPILEVTSAASQSTRQTTHLSVLNALCSFNQITSSVYIKNGLYVPWTGTVDRDI